MSSGWLPRDQWLKTLDARPASAGIILEAADGRVLAIKAGYKQHWGFPGGMIDPGESPLSAALREVEEEVGLILTPERLTFVSIAHRAGEQLSTHQYVFKAKVTDEELANIKLQDSEIEDSILLSAEEILSGERKTAWSMKTWAKGQSGYFETRIHDLDDGDSEEVLYHIEEGKWEN